MNKYKFTSDVKFFADHRDQISDIRILKILDIMYDGQWTKAAKDRIAYNKRIKDCTENGYVALVFSGMDCDCTSYDNEVHLIEANIKVIDEYLDDRHSWLDGPESSYIEKPSVAKELNRSSRDLALEAFENGHPHFISY